MSTRLERDAIKLLKYIYESDLLLVVEDFNRLREVDRQIYSILLRAKRTK